MIINSPYIIWDGSVISLYHKPKGHDCMVLKDGLVSVQNFRRDLINKGFEPVIIFSCKGLMPSYEINFPDEGWVGLFTWCWNKVLKPEIPIRDIITITNFEMQKFGLKQICEVICRLDILDFAFNTSVYNGRRIIFFSYDMCRTFGDWGLEIKNK